jgi:hypothetical protein
MKVTIPDFTNSNFLNSLFSKNFGPYIEFHQGLFEKDQELDQKLQKILPSRHYQGIFIHDIDIKQIDDILNYLILSEFLLLSEGELENEHVKIEVYNKELPQQISFLNPDFNTIATYLGEKKDKLYLIFMTDVLELISPINNDFGSKTDKDFNKRRASQAKNNSTLNKTAPPKYDHLITSKPDITMELVNEFIKKIDSDQDGRIVLEDVQQLIKRKNLAFPEDVKYSKTMLI